MRFINRKEQFDAGSRDSITKGVQFIEDTLKSIGIDSKLIMKTLLTSEEVLDQFIQHAKEGSGISIRVRRSFGDAEVYINCAGTEFDPGSIGTSESDLDQLDDDDARRAIQSIILKAQGERLKFSYKNGINRVRIQTGQNGRSMLVNTIIAMIAGGLFGVLLSFVFPQVITDICCTYLLNPFKTMFMNALNIIIAPVVFFSIVTCVSQFKDISELGRVGAKVMGMYMFTTLIAVTIAVCAFLIIRPGEYGFALSLEDMSQTISVDTDVDTSLLHTIVSIVPNNFVRPFLEADTLQIIFLALICGIAVGMIGQYSHILQGFFEACNSLFLTITTMIARFIPLVVFCSVALMIVELGGTSFLSVLGMAGTVIITMLCMMIIYGLLVLVMGHLNPLTFFKKNREGMLTSFTLCSSSAAMPVNMKTCTDKLGISHKICSFSIPLGATINMDGACIFLTIGGLFLARAYAIEISPTMMASLIVTIILLSLGAPGVPGSGLVCLGVVLAALGVPIEAIGIVMAIDPILDMFSTMSNTTGDVAATLIVAKKEKLLDLQKFNE